MSMKWLERRYVNRHWVTINVLNNAVNLLACGLKDIAACAHREIYPNSPATIWIGYNLSRRENLWRLRKCLRGQASKGCSRRIVYQRHVA